jgi:hypothetical protein
MVPHGAGVLATRIMGEESWEKTWENHGKIMGKSWENHGKFMGKS